MNNGTLLIAAALGFCVGVGLMGIAVCLWVAREILQARLTIIRRPRRGPRPSWQPDEDVEDFLSDLK